MKTDADTVDAISVATANKRTREDWWSWSDKMNARRTGKVCLLCGKHDVDQDSLSFCCVCLVVFVVVSHSFNHLMYTCGRSTCLHFDQDPCEPEKRIAWAKYNLDKDAAEGKVAIVVAVSVELMTDGSSCYYCFRGWHTIYRGSFTLTQYRAEVTFLICWLLI